MKSLKIIQVLAKIARIVCLVVFIASIVGAAGCFLGLVIFCAIKDIPYNGQTISSKLIVKCSECMRTLFINTLVLVSIGK